MFTGARRSASTHITVPCVTPMQDKAGSAKRYNREWTRISGIPLLWIEGAGHNSDTDKPEAVNEAIEGFMESCGRG